MGFSHYAHVQRHCDRIHKKSRPFECTICQGKFARNYELSQHMKTTHRETLKTESNIGSVPNDNTEVSTIVPQYGHEKSNKSLEDRDETFAALKSTLQRFRIYFFQNPSI